MHIQRELAMLMLFVKGSAPERFCCYDDILWRDFVGSLSVDVHTNVVDLVGSYLSDKNQCSRDA